MARSVPEWIGKTPDTPVPARVRIRVLIRNGRICQCGCGMKIRTGDRWETDHTIAIISGGENRESNLRSLLAGKGHHGAKTAADVADKAFVNRVIGKHYGLHRRRSRLPFGKDSPLKRKITGEVVRR